MNSSFTYQSFERRLFHWWFGANRAGVQGGAVTLKAYIAGSVANTTMAQLGHTVAALTFQQAGCVFLASFLYAFVDYCARNPMPDIDEPTPAPGPPTPAPAPAQV